MSRNKGKDGTLQAAAVTAHPQADRIPLELEEAFQEHHQRIFQAAYRVTGNASDAEDVLQTVFLRLMKHATLPGPAAELGSYLRRAAVNAGIDLLRSRKGHRRVPLDEVAQIVADEEEGGPETRRRHRELEQWLRSAVAGLSSQTAEIFVLRYVEGYKNLEIAEIVGTSPGVVAVVLHRARTRLREELDCFLGVSP